jgi:hypothetical protein
MGGGAGGGTAKSRALEMDWVYCKAEHKQHNDKMLNLLNF